MYNRGQEQKQRIGQADGKKVRTRYANVPEKAKRVCETWAPSVSCSVPVCNLRDQRRSETIGKRDSLMRGHDAECP